MAKKVDDEPKKQKPKKSLISLLLGKGKEKAKDLQIRLGRLSLQDLASLTQLIVSGIVAASSLTINLILSELKKRSQKNNESFQILLDDKAVGEVSPNMPEGEKERLVTIITKAVKNGVIVKYVSNRQPVITHIDHKLRGEVDEFQQQLDQLK